MKREQGGITARLVGLLCFALILVGIYLVRRPMLRFAGESLVVEDPLQKSDAIILLSMDNFYADRATRSAEIYRQGLAPLVVASGERLRPFAGAAELMEHDLLERGVPKDKILRFAHDSDSTREEAEALAKLASEKRWKSVIVVTSNYHTRRARYIFAKIFPGNVSVSIAAARDGDFDPEHWFEKRKGMKLFVREVAGMAVAIWELRGKEDKHLSSQRVVGGGTMNPQYAV